MPRERCGSMLDELHAISTLRGGRTGRWWTHVGEMVDWIVRARQMIPAADRKVLLDPLRLATRFARYAVRRGTGHAEQATADDVRARDPELVKLLGELLRFVADNYFRLRVEGIDHVPAHGGALLVGNHSGGLVPTEGFFSSLAIYDHFGPARARYGLGHDFLFDDPTLRSYATRLGILRAGHDSAHHAFADGHLLMVYPGSDLDTFRPFGDRGKIVLGGRTGFIRLALRERVPIVPVVTAGPHEQLIVLAHGGDATRARVPVGHHDRLPAVPATARADHAALPATARVARARPRGRGGSRDRAALLPRGRGGDAGRPRRAVAQPPVPARHRVTTRRPEPPRKFTQTC